MGECLLTHKALDFTPQHPISQLWWYSPVILAIWEMEAGKEKFKVVVGQPGLHETILGESQMIRCFLYQHHLFSPHGHSLVLHLYPTPRTSLPCLLEAGCPTAIRNLKCFSPLHR